MTSRVWVRNRAYDINVSHTVVAPGTPASPTRNGYVEVEFVLEECFLPYAQYDDPSPRTVTRHRIEVPLSHLSSLPNNLTTVLLSFAMMALLLPPTGCVHDELIRQLTVDARAAQLYLGSDPAGQVVFTVNITEESIKGLQRFVIVEEEDQETCAVCMDAMEPGDVRGARMPCGHVYHEHCIVKWLGVSCSCPICRYQLP